MTCGTLANTRVGEFLMNGEPERHNPPLAMFSADAAEHEQVVARFEQCARARRAAAD